MNEPWMQFGMLITATLLGLASGELLRRSTGSQFPKEATEGRSDEDSVDSNR